MRGARREVSPMTAAANEKKAKTILTVSGFNFQDEIIELRNFAFGSEIFQSPALPPFILYCSARISGENENIRCIIRTYIFAFILF